MRSVIGLLRQLSDSHQSPEPPLPQFGLIDLKRSSPHKVADLNNKKSNLHHTYALQLALYRKMLKYAFHIDVSVQDTYILQCHADNVDSQPNLIKVMVDKSKTAQRLLDDKAEQEDEEEKDELPNEDPLTTSSAPSITSTTSADPSIIPTTSVAPSTTTTSNHMSIKMSLARLKMSPEFEQGITILVKKLSRWLAQATNLGKVFFADQYEKGDKAADPTIVPLHIQTLWDWILKASSQEGLSKTYDGKLAGLGYVEALRELNKEVRSGSRNFEVVNHCLTLAKFPPPTALYK